MSDDNMLIRYLLVAILVPMGLMAGPQLAIDWSTIDGGGVQTSTGGPLELSGTLGQYDARNQPMTGRDLKLTGGFWVIPKCPAVVVDYDNDCDVDQGDYALFQDCASGPFVSYGTGCDDKDLDDDGDVDQADFGVFQRCYSGEDNPADPVCAH